MSITGAQIAHLIEVRTRRLIVSRVFVDPEDARLYAVGWVERDVDALRVEQNRFRSALRGLIERVGSDLAQEKFGRVVA